MDTHDRENAVQIRDLGLAAGLVCAGRCVLGTERNETNRVYFLFKNSDDLQTAIKAYWENELDVSARSYFEALRSLKNRIYSEKY